MSSPSSASATSGAAAPKGGEPKIAPADTSAAAAGAGSAPVGKHGGPAKPVAPDSFLAENHYYPRALGATIHPIVSSFFGMSNDRIIKRYCHLHPTVSPAALRSVLEYRPRHFRWAGCDLFNVTNETGHKNMVVVETNSCPSGQKSMPLLDDGQEMGGYKVVIENTFARVLEESTDVEGGLAVIYDKNVMEASGYAAALAEQTGETVYLTEFYENDPDPSAKFEDGVLMVRTEDMVWHPIRAAYRYVTQKPWTRIPLHSKTLVLNPVLPCLAGGRNKLVASKAYDFFNAELQSRRTGLAIRTPETRQDVGKAEVPMLVRMFGGKAVVKVPYLNAGQGVFTITSEGELERFMAQDWPYDKFIVQALIGNIGWSSTAPSGGKLFHVGTLPNKRNDIYCADIRMMVCATKTGFQPVAVYARRAHEPLRDDLVAGADSWSMLGTNLSVKTGNNTWDTETNRLLLMSTKDFNRLGVGIDELLDGYVQTVLSVIAIDKMAAGLLQADGSFNLDLFRSVNDDEGLISEIRLK